VFSSAEEAKAKREKFYAGKAIPVYDHPAPPQTVAIPEGFKLVVLEPTQHQLHEAYDNHLMEHFSRQSTGHELAKRIYKTMLSAAPKPEGK